MKTLENSLSVLAAPAGYTISDKTGSDPTISYNLLSLLSRLFNINFYAITNRVDVEEPLPATINLIKSGIERSDASEQILFMLSYYRTARKILKRGKIHIIHHITFSHGTFNPLFVRGFENIPFVIGPAYYDPSIQPELTEDLIATKWGRTWSDVSSQREVVIKKMAYKLLGYFRFLRLRLFEETLDRSDAVIVVNNSTKKEYSRFMSSKKIEVIPIGVKSEYFTFTPTPNTHDILAPANLIKLRGVQYIIEAMPKILKDFKDSKLHILGDGPQRSNLSRLAKRLKVADSIEFHGRVSHKDMLDFYKKCRVMCLASLHHTFGNVVLEAMASGRPVVTTDTLGPREIVVDGMTGFVVPRANVDAIADALIRVLGDYELTSRMGIEGRKLVEEEYDWKTIASRYYGVYEKLVQAQFSN